MLISTKNGLLIFITNSKQAYISMLMTYVIFVFSKKIFLEFKKQQQKTNKQKNTFFKKFFRIFFRKKTTTENQNKKATKITRF